MKDYHDFWLKFLIGIYNLTSNPRGGCLFFALLMPWERHESLYPPLNYELIVGQIIIFSFCKATGLEGKLRIQTSFIKVSLDACVLYRRYMKLIFMK